MWNNEGVALLTIAILRDDVQSAEDAIDVYNIGFPYRKGNNRRSINKFGKWATRYINHGYSVDDICNMASISGNTFRKNMRLYEASHDA